MRTGYRYDLAPLANPTWDQLVTRPLWSPEECAAVLGLLADDAWQSAGLAGYDDPVDAVNPRVRSALLQVLPDGGWPGADLMAAISEANAEAFRFDLRGLDPADAPAVIRYEAGTGDHFRPHADVGPTNATRKLTFVVQLTDPTTYEGGDLVFPDRGRSAARGQGTLIVFPSFVTHVVSPLVRGTRHALVSWIHGPTFT